MEPTRPLVDNTVYDLCQDHIPSVDRSTKTTLLAVLQQEVAYDGRKYYLTDALHRSASSLAQALESGHGKIFKCLSLC